MKHRGEPGHERDAAIAAAQHLRAMVDRVIGSGDGSSWLDQLAEHGELLHGPGWSAAEQQAAADLVVELAERVRRTRQKTGSFGHPRSEPAQPFGLADDSSLPLNRKERYYSGTVLPMVIGSDNFAHLHRFLELCGLPDAVSEMVADEEPDLQFFTEYSFAESVVTSQDRHRFADRPLEADTPDVVIVGRGWLLAVEAKIFHRPSKQALDEQVRRQRVLVDYWGQHLGVDQLAHVLLLPADLARARPGLSAPVVTLEQVLDAYSLVGPTYWVNVLRSVVNRYQELASSEPTFRTNADALLTGEDIVTRFESGDLDYSWIGRSGGPEGAALLEDLRTGTWLQRRYEVRHHPLPSNRNWFAVSEFVRRARRARFSVDASELVIDPPHLAPQAPVGQQGRVSLWARDKRYLDATLEEDGAVVLRGQNLAGPGEYEYAFRIEAKHVPRLRSALGGHGDQPILDLLAQHAPEIDRVGDGTWLKDHRIPAEFWSRVE